MYIEVPCMPAMAMGGRGWIMASQLQYHGASAVRAAGLFQAPHGATVTQRPTTQFSPVQTKKANLLQQDNTIQLGKFAARSKHLFGGMDIKSGFLPSGFKSSMNRGLERNPEVHAKSDTVTEDSSVLSENPYLVGEDAAVFDVSSQRLSSWLYFTLILAVVIVVLYFAWLDPTTGFGGAYIDWLSSLSNQNPEVVVIAMISIFALVHSSLASLREEGEKLIGARAYRVLFAGLSLPLAISAVVYFINHRYDGVQLWQVQTVPGVHQLVWLLSFVSFFFLYPSTFNLLEVAAVDKPKLHMWETGIMRITRHPQMVGQVMWCFAHTLWIGNSLALVTSLGLVGHHLFGVWNGDRRLSARYGEAFEVLKERTSVLPFLAIIQGRQRLPKDYHKEFLRVPYLVITGLTLGAYLSHPLLQMGSRSLHW